MQVHGIRGHRMVYKEVVEALSNHNNLTSGDMGIPLAVMQLGVTALKKIRLVHLLDFAV